LGITKKKEFERKEGMKKKKRSRGGGFFVKLPERYGETEGNEDELGKKLQRTRSKVPKQEKIPLRGV